MGCWYSTLSFIFTTVYIKLSYRNYIELIVFVDAFEQKYPYVNINRFLSIIDYQSYLSFISFASKKEIWKMLTRFPYEEFCIFSTWIKLLMTRFH
jgi:hypothetical protein